MELIDHKIEPAETRNIASTNSELVTRLMARFNSGPKGTLPESVNSD